MSCPSVSMEMPGRLKWTRSPQPVRLGAYTTCPAARSGAATFRQHHPPTYMPWTRTMGFKLTTLLYPCGDSLGFGENRGGPYEARALRGPAGGLENATSVVT